MRIPPAALLLLFFSWVAALAAPPDAWSGVERIVAVGDAHGDFDGFTEVLRSAGVIDKRNRWAAGRTHLVQTGDVLDRGPDSRKIMDLLMDLEKQARRAGGEVHALIGNHEAMNLYGDLRYVSPGEYAAFKAANSQEIRDAFYRQHLEERKQIPGAGAPGASYRKKWETERPLGFFEHRLNFGPKGEYGKWILGHNAVVKIDDSVFVHAGIGPKYAARTIAELNGQIRGELEDFTRLEGGAAMDEDGPLWYRGLAAGEEPGLEAHVDEVLKNLGVRRIVIGHTQTSDGITARFGGKVILIDVKISKYFDGAGRNASLLIEGGKLYAIDNGTKNELTAAPVPVP
jgi:Calcineurin-like phosphoesterase